MKKASKVHNLCCIGEEISQAGANQAGLIDSPGR